VADHPVRLTVTDDLRRSRLTIFFRLLLAIPHLVWWWLWTIAAVLAAVANWFATLVAGRPPNGLHRFLTAYVRYSTHLFAYLFLAANPYPGFTGEPGYPVDVEFGEPERQRRWVTALRLFLLIPALILAVAFEGSGFAASFRKDEASAAWSGGTLVTVAVFGWFACLVLGRMPQGFRDLQAYGLRFVAQVAAYGFVLTERYPNVDPAETPASGPDHPVRLTVDDDLKRSRLTVFFRLLLALPHFVWILLWWVAVIFAAFITWIAAVIIGRPPAGLHRFLSAFVRYSTHVTAYASLAANPFPGFTGRAGSYPVDPVLPPPEPQRRLVTFFRFFLGFPALAVSGALSGLLFLAGFLGWFASLALGRMPRSLREAQAYALRYSAQVSAYLLLVTGRYPYSGPALGPSEPEPEPEPEPPPAEAPAVA
jgi:TRAP-type mannitol/chloroaromatic compound transport system permease small subunit